MFKSPLSFLSRGVAGSALAMLLLLSGGAAASTLAQVGDTVYWLEPAIEEEKVQGATLWRTDGTGNGTVPVKSAPDWRLDSYSYSGKLMTAFKGALYFSMYDSRHGWELWKSDGTEEGTLLVKDIYPLENLSSNPRQLSVVGDTLFFLADDGDGTGLWKSDGTASGTIRFRTDLADGDELHSFNGALYFPTNFSLGIARTDGTEAGTVPLAGPGPSSGFFSRGGLLYFTGGHRKVWRTDGTPAGTFPLGVEGSGFAGLGNAVFFAGTHGLDSDFGVELWKSDGTAVGTEQVRDIRPGATSSSPSALTPVGGRIFFTAETFEHGRELWVSDGTSNGTRLVRDILPGNPIAFDAGPRFLIETGGLLFFSTRDTTGHGLWKSDGTEAGTTLVKRVNIGLPFALGGKLFFFVEGGLWTSDGTEAGTVLVKSLRSETVEGEDEGDAEGEPLEEGENEGEGEVPPFPLNVFTLGLLINLFSDFDGNGDGLLSRDEVPGLTAEDFDLLDANGDDAIDLAELRAYLRSISPLGCNCFGSDKSMDPRSVFWSFIGDWFTIGVALLAMLGFNRFYKP